MQWLHLDIRENKGDVMSGGQVCKLTGKFLHAYDWRCVDIPSGPNGKTQVDWFERAEAQLDKDFVDAFKQLIATAPKKPFSGTLFASDLGNVAAAVTWAKVDPKKSLQLFEKLIAFADNSLAGGQFNESHADTLLRIAEAMLKAGFVEEAMPVFERVFSSNLPDKRDTYHHIIRVASDLRWASVGEKATNVFQTMLVATESLTEGLAGNRWLQVEAFTMMGYSAGKLKLKEIAETSFGKAEAVAFLIDPKRLDRSLWQNIANARQLR